MSVVIDPITRIEGHLGIEVLTSSASAATGVLSKGTMWRGFELIMQNRNPRDAVIITQRICGV
jgi:Ni,Fe-hydrogenase I large subunit